MTRCSLLWWLRKRHKQNPTLTVCPTCNGVGMVRYKGQHPDGDGQYVQWALVCDPCQGTGETRKARPQERPPQAIKMAPGWNPVPRMDPRPLNMSKQSVRPANVLPFALKGPEPTTDKAWDDSTARMLMEWAQADALRDHDSGDENREQA